MKNLFFTQAFRLQEIFSAVNIEVVTAVNVDKIESLISVDIIIN